MKKVSILLTGGAGFIGSHIGEALVRDPRVGRVRVLDNLMTGRRENMTGILEWGEAEFVLGDIRDEQVCVEACRGMDVVCHQAALGSVPRSIADPLVTNAVNVTGTLNVLTAAREAGIRRVVYAASSSTYGDSTVSPRREEVVGRPISPYAVTKMVNELYAHVFSGLYGMECIGLRYFNVFGPRQNPEGAYAAVIPTFMAAVQRGEAPDIHGDGMQTRDFTYVSNVVDANLLALFTDNPAALNRVCNIGGGEEISIRNLFEAICRLAGVGMEPVYKEVRAGDVRHSIADISLAKEVLGYMPVVGVEDGLERVWRWMEACAEVPS